MRIAVGGVARRRLHDAGHVLDRHHAGARRGQRIGLAQVRRHRQTQLPGFVEQRPQESGRDLGVDLEIIDTRHRVLVRRAPRLVGRGDARRVRIGWRHAVDHRPGREHPRAALTPARAALTPAIAAR